jgi:hypothetical protein
MDGRTSSANRRIPTFAFYFCYEGTRVVGSSGDGDVPVDPLNPALSKSAESTTTHFRLTDG